MILIKKKGSAVSRAPRNKKKDKVFWKQGSSVYHLYDVCLGSSDPEKITLLLRTKAEKQGLKLCKKCAGFGESDYDGNQDLK